MQNFLFLDKTLFQVLNFFFIFLFQLFQLNTYNFTGPYGCVSKHCSPFFLFLSLENSNFYKKLTSGINFVSFLLGYNQSSLWLSDFSYQSNTPDLLYAGCAGKSYYYFFSLFSDGMFLSLFFFHLFKTTPNKQNQKTIGCSKNCQMQFSVNTVVFDSSSIVQLPSNWDLSMISASSVRKGKRERVLF